jgi:hypothetical protein
MNFSRDKNLILPWSLMIFCIKICRSGCSTSEDMLWKLDALQSFIRELHWPEEVFAEHLDHRLKLMAADMIEAAAKR